jgi:ribonuclease HIII
MIIKDKRIKEFYQIFKVVTSVNLLYLTPATYNYSDAFILIYALQLRAFY